MQRILVPLSIGLGLVVAVAFALAVWLSQRDEFTIRGEVAASGEESGSGGCFARVDGQRLGASTDVVVTAGGEEVGTGSLAFDRFEQVDAVRGRCWFDLEADVEDGHATYDIEIGPRTTTFERAELYSAVVVELD